MMVGAFRKSRWVQATLVALGFLVFAGNVPSSAEEAEAWPSKDLLQGELPLQVLVEVLIADIAHDKNEDLGIEHEFIDSGKGNVSLFNDLSRVSSSAPEYITRSQTGDLGSIITRFPLTERTDELFQGLDIVGQVLDVDSGQLFGAIQALVEEGKGEILSRPSVVALDGQEAMIKTGQEVPFLTRQIAGNQETIVSDQKRTGIELFVTPSVKRSDEGQYFVQLQVRPEVSFVSRRREEKGILLPVVATRKASTTVLVASGKTFILGGLYRDNETRIRRGVPGLSSIPLIGGIFSSTSRGSLKSELIISITPTVLDPTQELQKREAVFRPQEKKIPDRMDMKLLNGWGEVGKKSEIPQDATAEKVEANPVME